MKKKLPFELRKSKAKAAAMANATLGRSRCFESKKTYKRNSIEDLKERLRDL